MLTPSLCRHAESLHVNHSLSSTLSPLSAHQSYKPTEIASKVKSIVLLKKFKILDVLPHTANPHQTTLTQPAESTMVSLLHHKHRITMQWNNMGTGNSLHTNLTSLTPLFKGSDVPTKVGRKDFYWYTGAILAECLSCHYQWLVRVPAGVEPVLLCASPSP